jgi:hypothetical protein
MVKFLGVFQETGLERPSVELVNSQQSVKLGTHHSQRFANGKPETTTTSDKHAVLSINRNSEKSNQKMRLISGGRVFLMF